MKLCIKTKQQLQAQDWKTVQAKISLIMDSYLEIRDKTEILIMTMLIRKEIALLD